MEALSNTDSADCCRRAPDAAVPEDADGALADADADVERRLHDVLKVRCSNIRAYIHVPSEQLQRSLTHRDGFVLRARQR
jgi:hypothetical protein